MRSKGIRFLALAGILLTLFLSVWYLMKTYKENNPRWIFLILAVGVAILLIQNMGGARRR